MFVPQKAAFRQPRDEKSGLARKVAQHDEEIGILFEHIQGLLEPPEPPKKHPIGFRYPREDE